MTIRDHIADKFSEGDVALTLELTGRDGIIHYWQRMGQSGTSQDSWMLVRAHMARPTNNPDTVGLLIKYLGWYEWINVEKTDIVACK